MSDFRQVPVLYHAPTGYDGVVEPRLLCFPMPAHDARLASLGRPQCFGRDAILPRAAPERGLPQGIEFHGYCVINDVRRNGYYGFDCDPQGFSTSPGDGKSYAPGWYIVRWVRGLWRFGPGVIATRSPQNDNIGSREVASGLPPELPLYRSSPHAFHVVYRGAYGAVAEPLLGDPEPTGYYRDEREALKGILRGALAYAYAPPFDFLKEDFSGLVDNYGPYRLTIGETGWREDDRLNFLCGYANIRVGFYHHGGPIRMAFWDYLPGDNVMLTFPPTFALYKFNLTTPVALPIVVNGSDGAVEIRTDSSGRAYASPVYHEPDGAPIRLVMQSFFVRLASIPMFSKGGRIRVRPLHGVLAWATPYLDYNGPFEVWRDFDSRSVIHDFLFYVLSPATRFPELEIAVFQQDELAQLMSFRFDPEAAIDFASVVGPWPEAGRGLIDIKAHWYPTDWRFPVDGMSGYLPPGQLCRSYFQGMGATAKVVLKAGEEVVPLELLQRHGSFTPLPEHVAVQFLAERRALYYPLAFAGRAARLTVEFSEAGVPLSRPGFAAQLVL